MPYAALPPEINSTRLYSGPGSGPMRTAAAAWGGLAVELHSTATCCESAVEELTSQAWRGPASAALRAAASRYIGWLAATAAQAEQTAVQAGAAAEAYETAFAMTVPPSAVAANRARLLILVATNVLGQNTAAIAATEAEYGEMWAQDAAAMYGYAASSAPAAKLTPFTPPPRTTNPAGQAEQTAATAGNAGRSAGSGIQSALSQLSPASSAAAAPAPALPFTLADISGILSDLSGISALSGVSLATSAGSWYSADLSTREILEEQEQVQLVEYEILHAIDLFSPLTPSRPEGAITFPSGAVRASAAVGEAISAGKLSVPLSWAANAPEIRTLSYTTPLAGPAVGAAPAVPLSAAGTAFSQMGLAGMGGSALAGSVNRARQDGAVPAPPGQQMPESPPEAPEHPVTGIAAEIREFAELRDRGLISHEEYNEQKHRLLGR